VALKNQSVGSHHVENRPLGRASVRFPPTFTPHLQELIYSHLFIIAQLVSVNVLHLDLKGRWEPGQDRYRYDLSVITRRAPSHEWIY